MAKPTTYFVTAICKVNKNQSPHQESTKQGTSVRSYADEEDEKVVLCLSPALVVPVE